MVSQSWQKIMLLLFIVSSTLVYGQQYSKVVVVGASIVNDVYGSDINNPNTARTAQWNQNNVNVDVYGYGTDGHTIQNAIVTLGTAMNTHPTNTLFMVHIGGNNVTATRPFATATNSQKQAIESDYDALYNSIPVGRLKDVVIMPMTFRLYNELEDLVNNPEEGSLPYNENILIPRIAANTPGQMNIDGNPIIDLYHFTFQNYTTYFDINNNDGIHPSQPVGVDALSQFMCERAAYFINDGPLPEPLTNNIAVTGVTLTATNLDLALADTTTLVADVLPNNATNTIVSWTSSDTSVATIDMTGRVLSLAEGATTITATTEDGGFTVNLVINVSMDMDGDGILDVVENRNGTNANDPCDPAQTAGYTGYDSTNAIWSSADCDADGVANGDEFANGTDPYSVSGDTDGDGVIDDLEINEGTDASDPCDPGQTAGYTGYDSTNAIWSAADCDADGVANGDEFANGTDPYLVSGDTDGDGVIDDLEINDGTDANDPCDPAQTVGYTGYDSMNAIWSAADCDADGVANGDEFTNGTDPYIDEIRNDEDNDGQSNGMDNCFSEFNPNQEDFDGDGIGDVCDDDRDNDGVLNLDDNCDTTPNGAIVNEQGCEINLGSNNFDVKTFGETCVDSNDGSIEISTQLALEYTATLKQEESQIGGHYKFSDFLNISNLSPGTYILCIGITNSAEEQCYTLNIGSVEPLAVISEKNVANRELRLTLSGAQEYNVELNGEIMSTDKIEVVLPLSQLVNKLRVTTDSDCQGVYEDILVFGKKGLIYPNPVFDDGTVSLYIGEDATVLTDITIYDTYGSSVSTKIMVSDAFGFVHFEMENMAKGMYFVIAVTQNNVIHQKLLKK